MKGHGYTGIHIRKLAISGGEGKPSSCPAEAMLATFITQNNRFPNDPSLSPTLYDFLQGH